jgi:hypothetical protein
VRPVRLVRVNSRASYVLLNIPGTKLPPAYLIVRVRSVRFPMPTTESLLERARMFEERADLAVDPISRQHYREMAAHYRALSVEHAHAGREIEPAH